MMYTGGGHGCSFFLHLIAGYPKTVATLGLAALVGLLSTPLGPGSYPGTKAALDQVQARLADSCPAADEHVGQARELVRTGPELSDDDIATVLKKCPECADLSPADVRKDEELNRIVKFIYHLELRSQFCAQ